MAQAGTKSGDGGNVVDVLIAVAAASIVFLVVIKCMRACCGSREEEEDDDDELSDIGPEELDDEQRLAVADAVANVRPRPRGAGGGVRAAVSNSIPLPRRKNGHRRVPSHELDFDEI